MHYSYLNIMFIAFVMSIMGCFSTRGQQLQVSTLIKNLNASGGLTIDGEGNIYAADFGATFQDTSRTKVYKIENRSWKKSVFAEGFKGASGCYIDDEDNFYQSNPKGGQVSWVKPNGEVVFDYVAEDLKTPVGIVKNSQGELLICNCADNNIIKVDSNGKTSVFASGNEWFQCPNGITIHEDVLYVVNFNSDKIIKINPDGEVAVLVEGLQVLTGGPQQVGIGHITYSNQYLFATAIGRGLIYRISLDGVAEVIAGNGQFKNADGPAMDASFSKPNGIVPSITGDTLFVNVSDPTWVSNPPGLHPAHLMMVTGVCSLPDSKCEVK